MADTAPRVVPATAALPQETLRDRLRMQTWALYVIAFAALIGVLVAGRFILMSLVLAVMVFSLTLGTINRISRLNLGGIGLPRWLSYTVAMVLITGGLIFTSALMVNQLTALVIDMMAYSDVASQAISDLFGLFGENAASEVLSALRSININAYLRAVLGQLSTLMSVAVMTSMFAGFLFAEQFYFRPKLQALFPEGHKAAVAGRVVISILERINRYLLVKTVVSLGVGFIVYATMRGFGLQFAMAMGLISFVLNFIPNLGTLLASALAILAAFIQQPDWTVMVVFSLIVAAIQFVSGNILEPVLMGRKLALSTLGIVIALTFWGTVWGLVGMFLAVPLNVAVMVISSYVRPLHPLAVLLSRDGQLDTEALEPATP